jgi:surface polysaccharide O-acyltransferase-like enzyme
MYKLSPYYAFIALIFVVKILFFFALLAVIYTRTTGNINIETAKKWKHHLEYVFMMLMALLILYLFQKQTVKIEKEEKLLFIMFAIVVIINAFHELL